MTEQQVLFEGDKVDLSEIKLTGTIGGNNETLKIGDVAFFVVSGRVVGVNHEQKGKERVLVRSHKLEIVGAERIDAEAEVSEALIRDAAAYLRSIDPETGEIGGRE